MYNRQILEKKERNHFISDHKKNRNKPQRKMNFFQLTPRVVNVIFK